MNIVNEKECPVNIRILKITDGREVMLHLETFLESDEHKFGIIGHPGLGKSSSVIKYMLSKGKKFVYVAATKPVANQLGARFNLPVVHADSDDTKADQCITIYDHITDFIDFDNLEENKAKTLVVDECHNLILSRSKDFRYSAIRLVETFKKYFSKVLYLTATPIDYKAYGSEFEFLQFEDDSEPVTMYAVPFGTYSEVHDIAEITNFEVSKHNHQVLIYLQSLGKSLAELKSYLKQLGITSISVYNSQQNVWETEDYLAQENFVETGLVKAQVMITTYADGFSLMNEGFCFIAGNSANYHTVYQAMNRLRKGCVRYYYMTNAYKQGDSHDKVYERCFNEVKDNAKVMLDFVLKLFTPSDRQAYLESKKITTIDLDGRLVLPELARLAVDLQHKDFKENLYGLQTAFAEYNVNLKHQKRYPNRTELKFTQESMELILDYIYFSLENNQFIPKVWPYKDELEKIVNLEKYLSREATKAFMYGEYLKRQGAYDEYYKQLQLKDNPRDSQLKLRLTDVLKGKQKYDPDELQQLVDNECMKISYRYEGTVQALLRGLGFEVKRSSKHVGYETVWDEAKQQEITKKVTEPIYVVSI